MAGVTRYRDEWGFLFDKAFLFGGRIRETSC